MAVLQIPVLVGLTYEQAALASGRSRRFFVLQASRAGLTMAGLALGLTLGGFLGGLIGQGVAALLAYPVLVWVARREKAWDPRHDALAALAGIAIAALALALNWPAVAALAAVAPG